MCKNVERINQTSQVSDSVKTYELQIMVVFPCPLNDFISKPIPSTYNNFKSSIIKINSKMWC